MLRYVCLDAEENPVALELVKNHLNITVNSSNVVIQAMIDSATDFAERITNRGIRAKTWYAYADAFPTTCWELKRHPVDAVTQVRYPIETVETVVATSIYEIKMQAFSTLLLTADSQIWPSNSDIKSDAVRISFSTKADRRTPEMILAVMRHVAYLFENRGDDEQLLMEGDGKQFSMSRFYRDLMIPQI